MAEIKRVLILLIAFLYLANPAYAQDFSLFSGKFHDFAEGQKSIEFEFYNGTYNICENEKKTIPIMVVNKANIDGRYSLDATGASWAGLNVREFALQGKQNGVVLLSLNPSLGAEGQYTIKVNGFSSAGIEKSLGIDVDVEKCHSLNLEIEKEYDRVCGGESKKYSGELANGGLQRIDAELDVKGPNWISADKSEFSIDANEKQEFGLNADVPANAKGIFDVIAASSIKDLPSVKSEKKLSIEVVPAYDCYKPDFISDSKITSYYANEYVSVKIKNTGIKQAIYGISLDAPDWISVEPKKLVVNPGQSGNLNLNINPGNEITKGNYPIKINAQFSDILYSKNIEVILKRDKFANITSFFVFYQYYIYVILTVAAILFAFRRQISNKIKSKYKNYKIRKARLKALEAARKALAEKQLQKNKAKKEIKRKKFNLGFFIISLAIIFSVLFFSIYQFNFPVSKEFTKSYYAYFISGILIAFFIIFIIEFYKPLVKMLKK